MRTRVGIINRTGRPSKAGRALPAGWVGFRLGSIHIQFSYNSAWPPPAFSSSHSDMYDRQTAAWLCESDTLIVSLHDPLFWFASSINRIVRSKSDSSEAAGSPPPCAGPADCCHNDAGCAGGAGTRTGFPPIVEVGAMAGYPCGSGVGCNGTAGCSARYAACPAWREARLAPSCMNAGCACVCSLPARSTRILSLDEGDWFSRELCRERGGAIGGAPGGAWLGLAQSLEEVSSKLARRPVAASAACPGDGWGGAGA